VDDGGKNINTVASWQFRAAAGYSWGCGKRPIAYERWRAHRPFLNGWCSGQAH